MEHSSIADMAGPRSLAIQLGLGAIGMLSLVILFAFGGQLIVAPALLPVQWLISRHTDGWVANVFSILGSLLLAEVLLIATVLLLGEGPGAVASGAALAVGGAFVFYRTSQDRK